jgi:DNA repair protein RadA/Sms
LARKKTTAYVCNDCGADYTKWQGQCSDCGAWNTLTEVRLGAVTTPGSRSGSGFAGAADGVVNTLAEIELADIPRISAGSQELDLVLGGGLVPGSCILVGGEPGAGKSTLLLQTLCKLAESQVALYVTGEESPQQVAMRAHRLGLPVNRLQIMAETSVETVCATAARVQPKILVVDSIQVMQRFTGAGMCRNAGSLCKTDGHSVVAGGPCHQGWQSGWPQGVGAHDRLFADARGDQRQPFPDSAQPQKSLRCGQ